MIWHGLRAKMARGCRDEQKTNLPNIRCPKEAQKHLKSMQAENPKFRKIKYIQLVPVCTKTALLVYSMLHVCLYSKYPSPIDLNPPLPCTFINALICLRPVSISTKKCRFGQGPQKLLGKQKTTSLQSVAAGSRTGSTFDPSSFGNTWRTLQNNAGSIELLSPTFIVFIIFYHASLLPWSDYLWLRLASPWYLLRGDAACKIRPAQVRGGGWICLNVSCNKNRLNPQTIHSLWC